ncbi:protein DpdD [Schauerella aestuarii]|uniref:protein DpdD n=1 Tax=Schauerella aestuarii TaxID=2511204 RepID=UPI0013695B8D|nr:protein DpdD [Achromobacter aestuarii]MYZ42460.1 hypothetical protein [Achromobacter aestuarii]
MIDALRPADKSWLERFFSGRNSLKWESVLARSASPAWLEQALPWITAFSASGGRLPIVLPVFCSEGSAQWYAMAPDENGASALSMELTAFIGPSFSDFRGQFLEPDRDDAIENALLEHFGRFVFRLVPVNARDRLAIADALQLYLGLLRRRPSVPDRAQRPFGKVRAEFDRALLAGNELDAVRLRAELVGSGRLDTEQEKYLEIRMLAGLRRPLELAHNFPLVRSVLGLSLPAQTIADLVGALYSTHIADIEDSGDDELVLSVFGKKIAADFGPLFLERKGVMHPSVLKAFMLYELIQAEPNTERCLAIVSTYPDGCGRALVERWAERLVTSDVTPSTGIYELVRQAFGDEDYGLALQLSFDAFPDSWTFGALLRCAVEMDDAEIALRVLAAVETASEVERLKWTTRDLARLQQLLADIAVESGEVADPPSRTIRPEADWLSWVDYVKSGTQGRPPLEVLEDALPRWSVEAYALDPAICRELAERIGNAGGSAEQVFRDAFAPLVEFFVDRPERPVRAFAPLYAMLIRVVAWNGAVSANELELASAVIHALVGLAPSKEDYAEAVDAYSEIVGANRAPGNMDWALNAAEMLALHSSPDEESRLRLFMEVVGTARTYFHRLSPVQYEILSLLAQDYGCSSLLESFPGCNSFHEVLAPRVDFSGLIGIYTLTEPAGQRAKQFLKKLFPQAKVELNSDHVATEKLKVLAATADIFVFAWKSSKHQAYFAAKEARGARQTLLPIGKGSASILDCVLRKIAA